MLDGVRVIEMANVISGPFAGMLGRRRSLSSKWSARPTLTANQIAPLATLIKRMGKIKSAHHVRMQREGFSLMMGRN